MFGVCDDGMRLMDGGLEAASCRVRSGASALLCLQATGVAAALTKQQAGARNVITLGFDWTGY